MVRMNNRRRTLRKRSPFSLFLAVLGLGVLGVVSCVDKIPVKKSSYQSVPRSAASSSRAELAQALKMSSKITWLRRQVSGRTDGASSWDNIQQTASGRRARRSSYGNAPGGRTLLDPRMMRAMKILETEGYRFRVTSIAGGSHSRKSRHYAGLAFDVDMINGRKVGSSNPYWRKFLSRCRQLGATETLGPGDRGHSTHIHAAWPR